MIVREREKVVDERVVRRTKEVPCPITGQPKLQTIEYVEKVIETEVRDRRVIHKEKSFCTHKSGNEITATHLLLWPLRIRQMAMPN